MGSLEQVKMIQNGITWKGAVALADAFKKCPMTVINLNDNILIRVYIVFLHVLIVRLKTKILKIVLMNK